MIIINYLLNDYQRVITSLEQQKNHIKSYNFCTLSNEKLLNQYDAVIFKKQEMINSLQRAKNNREPDEDRIHKQSQTIQNLRKQVLELETTLEITSTNYTSNVNSLQESHTRVQTLLMQLQLLETQVHNLQKENEILHNEKKTLEANNNILIKEKQLEDENLQEFVKKIKGDLTFRTNKNTLITTFKQLSEELTKIKGELKDKDEMITRLSNANNQLINENERLKNQETVDIKKIKKELHNSNQQLKTAVVEAAEYKTYLEKAEMKINEQRHQIEIYQKLAGGFSGNEKMQYLIDTRNNLKSIITQVERVMSCAQHDVNKFNKYKQEFTVIANEAYGNLVNMKQTKDTKSKVQFEKNMEDLKKIVDKVTTLEEELTTRITDYNASIKKTKSNYNMFMESPPSIAEQAVTSKLRALSHQVGEPVSPQELLDLLTSPHVGQD